MDGNKYPARAHARKVIAELRKLLPTSSKDQHAIFLQAPPTPYRHDTDRELPYHQEANFTYLTGCPTPNSSVLVTFTGDNVKHQLFIPKADPLETMWSVPPPTLDEAKERFDSDEISFTSDLSATIKGLNNIALHTLPLITDYPPLPSSLLKTVNAEHNTEHLLTALHLARLIKDEHEIGLIREANRISSAAHETLMRELGKYTKRRSTTKEKGSKTTRTGKEGVSEWEVESEGDAEAVFVAACLRSGARQAYLPIVASGTRSSTLHYVCNDRLFPSTSVPRANGDTSFTPRPMTRGCCGSVPDHDHATTATSFHDSAFMPQVLLIDAGCEWEDYASDITRTMPIGNGGRFTDRAGEIYELVLRMQKECESMVRPGIHWDTIHLHGHTTLIQGFLTLGIFRGDPDTILQSGISAAFFPHGLGHSLGLDVHDSRQYLKSTHLELPATSSSTPTKLYTYLRIRLPLQQGMVLTVEPGCYFAPQLMEEHGVWTSSHVDQEKLREYISVGGVRIEDVVVVTENGCENLTTVGRERAWVEAVCSGSG